MSEEKRCPHGNQHPWACHECDEIAWNTRPNSAGDGWIVGNSAKTLWRTWSTMGPCWTPDPNEAIRYHRRLDAEMVHQEDDDAWCIVPFGDHRRPE